MATKKTKDTPAKPTTAGPKAARKPRAASTKPRRAARSATREASVRPTFDEIRDRAYQRYLERGMTPGNPDHDWIEAERDLSEGRSIR